MRFYLRKSNILRLEKEISRLFSSGQSYFKYPLKFTYYLADSVNGSLYRPFKVLFVVSRRNFKSAVKRNTVKRRMRESFRLSVNGFVYRIPDGKELHIAVSYVGKEEHSYQRIDRSIVAFFRELERKLNEPVGS